MTDEIEFRTLNYSDADELSDYIRIFWQIPLEHDQWFVPRSDQYLQEEAKKARAEETPENTFAGVAIQDAEIVGIHVLRRFEEWDRIGAHVAGLWVREDVRQQGIAARLKEMGEAWARSIGASFINTNVNAANGRMREINEGIGFVVYRHNMRKELEPSS